MQCCGKNVTTKFCPDCGQPNELATPLQSLMAHVKRSLHTIERRNADMVRYLSIPKCDHSEAQKSQLIAKGRTTQAKWESWVKALTEVVEKEQAQ